MAGMLYLPRLYVYHAAATQGSELSETLKVMERRLLRGIINPAMIATWIFGICIAIAGNWWSQGWLHGQLTLVILMQLTHALQSRWSRAFSAARTTHSPRFYRHFNKS